MPHHPIDDANLLLQTIQNHPSDDTKSSLWRIDRQRRKMLQIPPETMKIAFKERGDEEASEGCVA
jgi:hypothetical protein